MVEFDRCARALSPKTNKSTVSKTFSSTRRCSAAPPLLKLNHWMEDSRDAGRTVCLHRDCLADTRNLAVALYDTRYEAIHAVLRQQLHSFAWPSTRQLPVRPRVMLARNLTCRGRCSRRAGTRRSIVLWLVPPHGTNAVFFERQPILWVLHTPPTESTYPRCSRYGSISARLGASSCIANLWTGLYHHVPAS
ncbi:hypothetical protein GY45DRAFT_565355 [Cubamyces sp. BRFM 1775]|nr:hypothetical protein GY45DRAFT_565355 [Cubamyces sp. BRFM 1775]